MLEHSASKIGDKGGDHWAISSQLSTTAPDKGEVNIYEKNNLDKLQKTMAGRSVKSSVRNITSRLEVCSLQDNVSTASTEVSSSEGKETEATSLIEEEKNGSPKKKKLSLKIMKQNGANVFIDDDIHSPNRGVYLSEKLVHLFIYKYEENFFSQNFIPLGEPSKHSSSMWSGTLGTAVDGSGTMISSANHLWLKRLKESRLLVNNFHRAPTNRVSQAQSFLCCPNS